MLWRIDTPHAGFDIQYGGQLKFHNNTLNTWLEYILTILGNTGTGQGTRGQAVAHGTRNLLGALFRALG